MIDIALFDDHKLLANGLAVLLDGVSDIQIVFTCHERETLIRKLKTSRIHVLIFHMQDLSNRNFNLVVQLNLLNPQVKILVISSVDGEEAVLRTIKAGAKGFLGKDAERSDLLEAVYTLRAGHDYFSRPITHFILNQYLAGMENPGAGVPSLSARQLEILKLWGEGYTNQEIADRLFISIRTVETHKNHMMQKLNLKSAVDMIKFAIRNNIIEI